MWFTAESFSAVSAIWSWDFCLIVKVDGRGTVILYSDSGPLSNKTAFFLQGRPLSFSLSNDRTQIYVVQRKFKIGEKVRLELSGNSSEIVFYVYWYQLSIPKVKMFETVKLSKFSLLVRFDDLEQWTLWSLHLRRLSLQGWRLSTSTIHQFRPWSTQMLPPRWVILIF